MARYASLGDCTDPVVRVSDADLESADRAVLALLRQRGIDPETVIGQDGLDLLRDVAVAEATATAARRSAVEGDSGQWRKSDAYRQAARDAAARVDRESLGLAPPGSGAAGYGSIRMGRG